MTIKRLLSLSILCVAAIACALSIMMAVRQYNQLTLSQDARLRLEVVRALADVPRVMNPERGLLTLAIQTMTSDQVSRTDLPAYREASEKALAAIRARTEATVGQLADADAIIAVSKQLDEAYRQIKDTQSSAMALPINQRGTAANVVTDKASAMNTLAAQALNTQLRKMAPANGVAFAWGNVGAAVLDLRDYGGRQAGMLQSLVAAHKPVTPEQRIQFYTLQGRVDQLWGGLWELRNVTGGAPSFKPALDKANSEYIQFFAGLRDEMAKYFETGDFPIDGSTYRERTFRMWNVVIALRDAAFEGSELAIDSAIASARQNLILSVVGLVVVVLAALAVLVVVQRRAIRPLFQMTAAIGRIADGELETEIPGVGRKDEIGHMASSVQVFKDSLLRNSALEAETAAARARSEAERRDAMQQLADLFETNVGGIIGAVGASADQLKASAQVLSQSADDTAGRSNTVAAAAEQAAANVNVVASSAEELGSSVQEIRRQVQQAADVSMTAVNEAHATGEIVRELSLAAAKISDILNLISSIAGQTNLLALNATIEAARAGEAGKGFAVVASEVKELADQTAKATSEISGQVGAIQSTTGKAVDAIGRIATTIQEMNTYANAVAAAVAQQGVATGEIVRSVAEASAGTSEVTGNITGVAQTAQSVGSAAGQVLTLSSDLQGQAQALSAEMARFLQTVRAA